jgi:hypothetical protein
VNDNANGRAHSQGWDVSDTERVDALERRLDRLTGHMDVGFDGINFRLDGMRKDIEETLSQVLDLHKRFLVLLETIRPVKAARSRGKK